MSLRAFHIVFILLSIALLIGFGSWVNENGSQSHFLLSPLAAKIYILLGGALSAYLIWFVRKARKSLNP